MLTNKILSEQALKAICDILAHTNDGYTKKELSHLLRQCRIVEVDDGASSNGFTYTFGLNKRDWLYKCMATEIKKSNSLDRIYKFIEASLNPIGHTDEKKRDRYKYLFEEVNKVLLLVGLEVTDKGGLQEAIKAQTLDEVDRRVNNLKKQLYNRAIHREVEKYCIKDYLRKDYYDTVFEATKGLAERVRTITGLTTDGGTLFQTAFSQKNPYLFFNALKTDSEISEFVGLKELLEALFQVVRTPAAHTPKVNWKIDETKALDILTLISFTHKYLDECHPMPKS
jgi:uncharacterized protein (TIGR02391 family)